MASCFSPPVCSARGAEPARKRISSYLAFSHHRRMHSGLSYGLSSGRRIVAGSSASHLSLFFLLPKLSNHRKSDSSKSSSSVERTLEMCEPRARCAPAQWMQMRMPARGRSGEGAKSRRGWEAASAHRNPAPPTWCPALHTQRMCHFLRRGKPAIAAAVRRGAASAHRRRPCCAPQWQTTQ